MTISNELLIDAAMNAAGYLLAGTFMVLICWMFLKRCEKKRDLAVVQSHETISERVTSPAANNAGKIEFVDFKGNSYNNPKSKEISDNAGRPDNKLQRNQLKIIAQANEMLQRGNASQKTVRHSRIAEKGWSETRSHSAAHLVIGVANDQ
ncbi:MAG: hypothetical protein ACREBV_02945 [Candidatus Zixiibacteriota bacterium]